MANIETRGRKSNYEKGQKSTSTNKNGKRPVSIVLDEMVYNNFKILFGLKSNELIQHFIFEMVRLRENYDKKEHSPLETEIKTYSQIIDICNKKFESIINEIEYEDKQKKKRDDERILMIREIQDRYSESVLIEIRKMYKFININYKQGNTDNLKSLFMRIKEEILLKYKLDDISFMTDEYIISLYELEQKRRKEQQQLNTRKSQD